MSTDLKVIIIGSGLGGLSLAQSLHRSEIPFEVFERDKSPFERSQGYRLHLDADAINTVHEVMPAHLVELFTNTAQWTAPYTSIMNYRDLSPIKRILTKDETGTGVWPLSDHDTPPKHANIDRAILRQILLTGLDKHIHYGKKFERYEVDKQRNVISHFADGTTASGTVLVGADGVNSPVRQQRAPDNGTMDAGITAIYGRLPISAVTELATKEAREDIFLIGSDERKVFLGLGPVIFPMSPDEAASKIAPESKLSKQDSYAVCIVGCRHELLPRDIKTSSHAQLQQIAVGLIRDWPGNGPELVARGDPSSFFSVRMRTSLAQPLAPTDDPVTLLGDAIHSMTPSLGRGANLAMRHGALLGRYLKRVANGEDLNKAIQAFETQMMEYANRVVRETVQIGQQRMNQNPLEEV